MDNNKADYLNMDHEEVMVFDDDDYELVINDITVHVKTWNDPELVITIEEWMTKLTSEDRGYNEICYLKMLRRMLVHRRVCWPFVDPPSAGPLLPLLQFMNSPGESCNDMDVSQKCYIKSLRRTTCTRASQTVDEYEKDEAEDEEEEKDEELIDGLADLGIEDRKIVINKTDMDNGVNEKFDGDSEVREDNDDKDGAVADKNYKDKIGNGGENHNGEENKMDS